MRYQSVIKLIEQGRAAENLIRIIVKGRNNDLFSSHNSIEKNKEIMALLE